MISFLKICGKLKWPLSLHGYFICFFGLSLLKKKKRMTNFLVIRASRQFLYVLGLLLSNLVITGGRTYGHVTTKISQMHR